MTRLSEILFVDPFVSDLDIILRNLRVEVEAIVLDASHRPARQMAAAIEGRYGLEAVHIIAHGAPGRVRFAAGEWSADTLEEDVQDFAAIGVALSKGGDLRLWSCCTGAGSVGTAFVDSLAQATGAKIAAASGLIGAADRGGTWELNARANITAHPPLTEKGVAGYASVLAPNYWQGPGGTAANPTSGNWSTGTNWSSGSSSTGDINTLAGSATYTVRLIRR